jgi:hypothetical protein
VNRTLAFFVRTTALFYLVRVSLKDIGDLNIGAAAPGFPEFETRADIPFHSPERQSALGMPSRQVGKAVGYAKEAKCLVFCRIYPEDGTSGPARNWRLFDH